MAMPFGLDANCWKWWRRGCLSSPSASEIQSPTPFRAVNAFLLAFGTHWDDIRYQVCRLCQTRVVLNVVGVDGSDFGGGTVLKTRKFVLFFNFQRLLASLTVVLNARKDLGTLTTIHTVVQNHQYYTRGIYLTPSTFFLSQVGRLYGVAIQVAALASASRGTA